MIHSVIVIDIGKTHTKVVLVDAPTAEEVRVTTQAIPSKNTAPYPHLDHERMWSFICESISDIASESQVDAIITTTHGASVALINAEGELAFPVVDYEFAGINETSDDYDNVRPPFSLTGSPKLPDGLNVGAQLFWLQKKFPDEFNQVKTILTWPQYWVYRLTGNLSNDTTSLGCHTDLYQPYQQQYSGMVDAMGWETLMPPTVVSGSECGPVKTDILKSLGLSRSIPVFNGIHDSNASLVPHLLVDHPQFSVVSTGTWFISMAINGEPMELENDRDLLLNVNAMGNGVPSARFMGGREREELEGTSEINDLAIEQFLEHENAQCYILPSVVKGTGPYATLNHAILGEKPLQRDMYNAAISIYLALMTSECLSLIGSRGTTFVEGPVAQDELYSQMLQVATGRTVMVSHAMTGTSIGAAMLVQAPNKKPDYASVKLSHERRKLLERYCHKWKEALENHAK